MSGLALTVYPLHHRQFFIRFETSHGPSWDGETTYKITSDLFPTEHFDKRCRLIKKPLIWPDNVKHVVDECTSSAIKSDISDDEIATILTKAGLLNAYTKHSEEELHEYLQAVDIPDSEIAQYYSSNPNCDPHHRDEFDIENEIEPSRWSLMKKSHHHGPYQPDECDIIRRRRYTYAEIVQEAIEMVEGKYGQNATADCDYDEIDLGLGMYPHEIFDVLDLDSGAYREYQACFVEAGSFDWTTFEGRHAYLVANGDGIHINGKWL